MPMHSKILYALIAKGTYVLAEYETVINDNEKEIKINVKPGSNFNTSNPPDDARDLLGLDAINNNNKSRHEHVDHEHTHGSSDHEDYASMARKVLGRIRRDPGMHSYLYGSYMLTYVSFVAVNIEN